MSPAGSSSAVAAGSQAVDCPEVMLSAPCLVLKFADYTSHCYWELVALANLGDVAEPCQSQHSSVNEQIGVACYESYNKNKFIVTMTGAVRKLNFKHCKGNIK